MKRVITTETQRVFDAVVSELDYQAQQIDNPDRPDISGGLGIGELMLAMEENLTRARRAWYTDSPPYNSTTNYLRKVLALGVRAGQQHGMLRRVLEESKETDTFLFDI